MAGTASRRLLFRETTDLSDVSPLSPSTEEEDENHPPNVSPNKNVTPIKGMKCLSSLSLESPVRVYSEGHTKVRGVHSLRCTSPAEIPPSRFYGSQTEPRNPSKSWLRGVVPKAKTKLFLDDLPSNKKRSRTSSGQKEQPPHKRIRRTATSNIKRTLAFVPRLGVKAPFKRSKKKPPVHESRKRRRTVSPEGSAPVRGNSRSRTPNSKTPKALVSYKSYDGDDGCDSWNITFTKRSIPCEESIFLGSHKKFFKSPSGNKRIESKVLTPPSSKRKQRALCRPDLLYMSPVKNDQSSPLRRSPRKKVALSEKDGALSDKEGSTPKKTSSSPRKSPRKLSESPRKRAMISAAREMIKDIEDMMDDGTVSGAAVDISNLLDNLNHEDVKTANPRLEDLSTALPSPDETQTSSDGQSVDDEMKKFFPVFHPNHAKKDMFLGVSPKSNNDSKRRMKLMGMGENQYQIDNGQKGLCEVTCQGCGLFYCKGCPEDEVLHEKFHNSSSLFTHQGWKKERVVGRKDSDKVIRVQPGDPRAWWNKVQNIVSLVDDLLGFPPIKLDETTDPIVYLYVTGEGRIVGCLVIEAINTGYRLLTGSKDCGVDQCDDEPCPVRAGVSRLWVHPTARRRRVGTSLLNSFRATFFYGTILRKEDIAVSVPTDEGKKFFASYMGHPDYLVYL